jgi:hypothetical protein
VHAICPAILLSHWYNQPNNIWRRVQIMKLLIMQFYLSSSYFPLYPNILFKFWHFVRCYFITVRDYKRNPQDGHWFQNAWNTLISGNQINKKAPNQITTVTNYQYRSEPVT